jgi:hypothetical protein
MISLITGLGNNVRRLIKKKDAYAYANVIRNSII